MVGIGGRHSVSRFAGCMANRRMEAALEELLSTWDDLERTLIHVLESMVGDGANECAPKADTLLAGLASRPDQKEVLRSILDRFQSAATRADALASCVVEFRLLADRCHDYRAGIWTTAGNDRDLFLREPGALFDGFLGARCIAMEEIVAMRDRIRCLQVALVEALSVESACSTEPGRIDAKFV